MSAAKIVLPCLLCLLPLLKASAQAPPAPANLGSDLRALPPAAFSSGSLVLSVSSQRVTPLPVPVLDPNASADPNAPAADPNAAAPSQLPPAVVFPTLDTVAARYGRLESWFSHVGAIAPPTMTVLNSSPALAELPLGSLAGQHPETYLLGSLTPEQLRQIAGPGLAYADMTAAQQSLVQALVPEPLEILPASAALPERLPSVSPEEYKMERDQFDAQIQKVSGEALYSNLRLHAYLTADFYVHAPKGYGIGDTRELAESTGAFKLPFSGYRNQDHVGKGMEKTLRADVPNAPKPGDLDWGRTVLRRTLFLQSTGTVDDLMARLAKATGLELYADTHYGPQTLLAVGDLKTPQPAGDVMQALALCVCGTWRQVGPAYVLTDDEAGLGTRQQFLAETAAIWSNRLSQAGKDAGTQLEALDWLHSLSFVPGDLGTLSQAQVAAIQKENDTNKGNLPWKDLPLPLRRHLLQVFSHRNDDLVAMVSKFAPDTAAELTKEGDSMKAAARTVQPDTPVETTLNIRLGVELPGTGAMMLYGDYRVQAPEPALTVPAKPEGPPAGPVTLTAPLRAALCAPRTPDEARAVVARLPKMGLNTLFLDVFTGGRTFFPNTALPPASDKASGVLQAALAAAVPLHIPVYAVLDTFCWRKDGLAVHPQPWPAGFAEDLTLSGETPDRAIQRRESAGSLSADYDHPRVALATEGTEAWASPLDPAVRTLLPTLAETLAAIKGLAGVVFQDTAPPGYSSRAVDYGDRIGLGYTPQNRLAYLRRMHQDPIDLSADTDMVSVFVGGEFFFGHYQIGIPTFGAAAGDYAAWSKYREGADRSLLTACWQSARTAAPALPLLRRSSSEFILWPASEIADPHPALDGHDSGRQAAPGSILCVAFGPDEQAHPERFLQSLQFLSSSRSGSAAAGIVFDLVAGNSAASLADTLDRLEARLKEVSAPAEKTKN